MEGENEARASFPFQALFSPPAPFIDSLSPVFSPVMNEFPKWLLALAGISLLPVLCSPFYLFAAQPFGTSESSFVRFLLYLATQLLWVIPLALFFVSLDRYRRGHERSAVVIASLSALLTLGGAWYSFL